MRRLLAPATVALALVAGACSNDDDADAGVVSAGPVPSSTTAGLTATASPGAGAAGFSPVSDVAAHAALGADVATVKTLLEAAKENRPVDWTAVRTAFTTGGASVKGDGSVRTLEKLVEAPEVVALVLSAVDGTGASAGAADAVRAQRVDKGISVLLGAKVRDELATAADKVARGEVAAATGAPHNVDEAWAFFTAGGNGLISTAEKRAADFSRQGTVAEPVLAALAGAQKAALAGDATGLAAAATQVGHALDYVFYLATHKYLDTGGRDATRAEGESFYLAIQAAVRAADPAADAAITAAFTGGDTAAGRAALHRPTVLAALGVDDTERVDRP